MTFEYGAPITIDHFIEHLRTDPIVPGQFKFSDLQPYEGAIPRVETASIRITFTPDSTEEIEYIYDAFAPVTITRKPATVKTADRTMIYNHYDTPLQTTVTGLIPHDVALWRPFYRYQFNTEYLDVGTYTGISSINDNFLFPYDQYDITHNTFTLTILPAPMTVTRRRCIAHCQLG